MPSMYICVQCADKDGTPHTFPKHIGRIKMYGRRRYYGRRRTYGRRRYSRRRYY